VSDEDVDETAFDDEADTGPIHVPAADPAPGSWEGRFKAPLTINPRQVRSPRNPNVVLGAVGAVVAVVLIGGLVFWLTRPSSDEPEAGYANPSPTTTASSAAPASNAEDESRLTRLLPRGYPADACEAVSPPKDTLAQLNCAANTDPDGPGSAAYTLVPDKAALEAVFDSIVRSAQRVNCPGNIQSPGPWRRNATPQSVSGMLFCGLRDGQPTVAWTDDARLTINAVQSGPQGPTFAALYAWWSSHS
jgi:hypothetical protein